MGASISLDSKYRLLLNVEVECISANEPSDKKTKDREPRRDEHRKQDDDSDHSDDSDDSHDSDHSDHSDHSDDSDSDSENKTYTVKITPEIVGYIRSYLRKNTFLDEFDLITEIELEKYEHAPGSALVFGCLYHK
jgi:hypothetical protein